MNTKTLLLFTSLVFVIGCSSGEPTNVASDASQEAIENYERLIEEEARKVSQDVEDKDI